MAVKDTCCAVTVDFSMNAFVVLVMVFTALPAPAPAATPIVP